MGGPAIRQTPDVDRKLAEFETGLAEIKQQFERWNGEDILNRHRIGCLVSKIKDAPTYGSKAIPRLVRELNVGKSWLYETATVAEAWTEGQLKILLKRKDAKRGRSLNWSHFARIAQFADPKERGDWLESTLREGLSAKEIKNDAPEVDVDPLVDGTMASRDLRHWMMDVIARSEAVTQSCESWRNIVCEAGDSPLEMEKDIRRTLERIHGAKAALDEIGMGLEEILGDKEIPA